MTNIREEIKDAKRIVIKIGSSTLTYENLKLNLGQIERLIREISDLKNQEKEIILVSSGAVAAGRGELEGINNLETIPAKQALASVGQSSLMTTYRKLFSEFGYRAGQILLTQRDISERYRYLNARNTINQLLEYNVIPIVNENDTVATKEIKFGDNDNLSALVSSLANADLLIILSDIDGLYTADPRKDSSAKLIKQVEDISKVEALAGEAGSKRGTGGMATKIEAAKIATKAGIPLIIANGSKRGVLNRICQGLEEGTLFSAQNRLASREKWIAFNTADKGKLIIDQGAEKALLEQGGSLLPCGIEKIEGQFQTGDVVDILNQRGVKIARGLSNYSYDEVKLIKGLQSQEIEQKLGYKDYDEVVHRNNLVFL